MQINSRLAALCAALMLAACGGGGDGAAQPGSAISSEPGTLRVSLTDAPACGYDHVYVTVVGVRVHKSESAAEDAGGWVDLSLLTPLRVDLLDLTNGELQELGRVGLPSGKYTQMRLILADNAGTVPYANAVVPTGGNETALTTPSAQQSGLKINVNVDVPPGQVAHVVIDFDACKSVVKRGKSGQYNLKPVLSATVLLSDIGMRVVGWVSQPLANAYAQVSLQFNGVPVKATVPNPLTGRFVLYPVPVGTYDLVIATPGHATAVMTGVPVLANADIAVSGPLQRIDTQVSGMRAVPGSVVPTSATVRALQTLNTPGVQTTVEVAWGVVDAGSGAFGFSLPSAAPVWASYLNINPLLASLVVPPPQLVFTPDDDAAGLYTIAAASNGAAKTQSIDVLPTTPPTDVPSVDFTFP